jgi:uncharacterized protein YndB with AHSA1/START domain
VCHNGSIIDAICLATKFLCATVGATTDNATIPFSHQENVLLVAKPLLMFQYDWSKFSRKIYIKANMQQVYDAWTTRTNLESWFLKKAEFTKTDGTVRDNNDHIKKGDIYTWVWHGHPDTSAERGIITEANGTDKLRFVFGEAGIVTVHLKQLKQDTEVLLTQEQIPTDEKGRARYHVDCSSGWTFYLANIKSVLEGGLDLRNKEMEYKGVVNS